MKTRIEEIIKKYNMSSSQFADKIGVPRSGLSHVIKGRNKPSLDYVLRILKSFPEIDSDWLLTGQNRDRESVQNDEFFLQEKGLENRVNIEEELQENHMEFEQNTNEINSQFIEKTAAREEENSPYFRKKLEDKISEKQNKKLEKIVFFYSDGSFKEYEK